jgi:hypothetical protein
MALYPPTHFPVGLDKLQGYSSAWYRGNETHNRDCQLGRGGIKYTSALYDAETLNVGTVHVYQTARRHCRVNVRCDALSSWGRSLEDRSFFIFRVRQFESNIKLSFRKVLIACSVALHGTTEASSERSEVLQRVECCTVGAMARSLGASSVCCFHVAFHSSVRGLHQSLRVSV